MGWEECECCGSDSLGMNRINPMVVVFLELEVVLLLAKYFAVKVAFRKYVSLDIYINHCRKNVCFWGFSVVNFVVEQKAF